MGVIAIDFDGVLHDQNPPPGKRMGRPLPGALDSYIALTQRGHTLVVFTVRAVTKPGAVAVHQWLNYFNFPQREVTAVKPNAEVFIDDRAIRFESWQQVMEELK